MDKLKNRLVVNVQYPSTKLLGKTKKESFPDIVLLSPADRDVKQDMEVGQENKNKNILTRDANSIDTAENSKDM